MRAFCLFATLLLGCSVSHDVGPESDAAMLAPLDASGDAAVDPRVALTEEQAACLGLDAPGCVSCHLDDEHWVLRPVGAPPPEGPTPVMPGECGIDVGP